MHNKLHDWFYLFPDIQVFANPSESVELECGIMWDVEFCLWEKEDHIINVNK